MLILLGLYSYNTLCNCHIEGTKAEDAGLNEAVPNFKIGSTSVLTQRLVATVAAFTISGQVFILLLNIGI